MSQNQPNPVPAFDPWAATPAPKPKKRRTWLLPTAIGVVAFGIGLGAGGGAPAAAEPEVVTEVVEKEVEKKVEVPVEVEVPVDNPACIEALDLADQGFQIAAKVMGAINDFDTPGIVAGNDELSAIVDPYNLAKAKCRAGVL